MSNNGDAGDVSMTLYEIEGVDKEQIVSTIIDYIRIDNNSERIVLTSQFNTLSNRQKTIAVLLGQRLLSIETEADAYLTVEEIAVVAESDLTELYPSIRKLEQNGMISNENGKYCVPREKTTEAVDILPS